MFPAAEDGHAGSPPCYETQAESETSCRELQALPPPGSCWERRNSVSGSLQSHDRTVNTSIKRHTGGNV